MIVLHGGLKDWFEAQGLTAHVTVTDETDYAASFVVVEQKEKTHERTRPADHRRRRPRLTDADRRRLAHPLVGGMILFGATGRTARSSPRLCAEIKAVRADLLICVDHEGGRVQRFRTDGFTHLPPMRALGELWMQRRRMARHAMPATRRAATCWAPSCAPAASTSASRRCWTWTTAKAA